MATYSAIKLTPGVKLTGIYATVETVCAALLATDLVETNVRLSRARVIYGATVRGYSLDTLAELLRLRGSTISKPAVHQFARGIELSVKFGFTSIDSADLVSIGLYQTTSYGELVVKVKEAMKQAPTDTAKRLAYYVDTAATLRTAHLTTIKDKRAAGKTPVGPAEPPVEDDSTGESPTVPTVSTVSTVSTGVSLDELLTTLDRFNVDGLDLDGLALVRLALDGLHDRIDGAQLALVTVSIA